ncbi:zinc-binding dehydrogenase, partial [Klenkia sp. PcliD-1-E]|uniref:zinc-binding dehydrogenase n=1 Tax=Klenkia sp. PcliD-1-E TaxID=2954492 RepID=UPI002096D424
AGAHVVATASPRSRDAVLAAGAAEVVDRTRTELAAAVTEPVDLALNLAPLEPAAFTALTGLVRDGGAVVSTTVWMPAPGDEARGVRGVDVYVRSDAVQLAELVARVDRGELRVAVAERVPLAQLADVHTRAAAGDLPGKVVVEVAR